MKTVPGHKPLVTRDITFDGLRDQDDIQARRNKEAGFDVIYGNATEKVDFAGALETRLASRDKKPTVVHFDLDVLDSTLGDVNGYSTSGGLFEEDVEKCFKLTAKYTSTMALTVASYNPRLGGGDEIAKIAIRRIVELVEAMIENKVVVPAST
jgi:arginase